MPHLRETSRKPVRVCERSKILHIHPQHRRSPNMNPELAAKLTQDLDRMSWHMDMLFLTCMAALGLVGILLIRSWRS